ncbi:N(5)-(carboxyethyl)ornithine synthase [Myroides odoratimimus]|uniref:N(5)-(carboxyethyl)ornithine synthase n=1 Tax=Myroides odoratimimus TaxID=76832 RepID=UPI00091CD29D|nr:N(5)-(carboxyethyl)ornithine synthase [Myroides odoratimimus]SHM66997.1 N5-(carboxyethyl)ornithine synthase [Myroides odoratimimus subsp. xuanwuensis]
MKTVGFPISQKNNEKRRCLIPSDIRSIVNKQQIFVEKGYGLVLGYSDEDYINAGVNVVTQDEVLAKDIICDGKIGDAAYLDKLKNQTIYGWVHAVQNREITDLLINNKLTAYAWEDMFEDGRHTFWRNNEIAGEAAIMHAYTLHGLFPYDTKVAIIGRGNIGKGALKILTFMGADVTMYDRKTEKLFQKELDQFDVVVNCILWDTSRTDHIIYKEDLKRMKKGALIIDVSCDRSGGIETCIPTSMDNPTYVVDNVVHYAVDHTPSIFYKTISKSLSQEVSRTIDMLIEESVNNVLQDALIVKEGIVVDQRINAFQNR